MDEFFRLIFHFIDIVLPIEAFSMAFMKRALIGVVILAPLCAAMGVQVVNFSMAFFSDAISHSAFTGVALGLIFSLNPYISMVLFGLLVGLAITQVKHESSLSNDTVVGVFFSATVALGIVIISAQKGLTHELQGYLYGDILTLSYNEIVFIMFLAVLVGGFLAFSYNKLVIMGVNRPLAHSNAVPVRVYDYLFALFLALVVMVTIRVVGLLLVTAMLIVPAAAGRNVARNVSQMFWLSTVFAMFSGITGLLASYYCDAAAGASIILVSCIVFLITQIVNYLRKN